MSGAAILHETRERLRLALPPRADAATVQARLEQLPGVRTVRVNGTLHCVVVGHDGRSATRDGVLACLDQVCQPTRPPRRGGAAAAPRRRRRESAAAVWTPALMAIALPLLPANWRAGGALATVAARAVAQREHWRRDPAAVLLDATALAAAALSGHPLVVTASVLARTLSESWSARLVDQADALLAHLLPVEAPTYPVRTPARGRRAWVATPLAQLRAGDRLRLEAGAVVPVDGRVAAGQATLAPAVHHASAAARPIGPGDHIAAGEQLVGGGVELVAEADVPGSRLERLRAHVRHAAGARDPAGRLTAEVDRLVAVPLTGAALVLGLTGDGSRAAAMLQADPQQGIDLALPVAREAALYALARQGLLAGGLEVIERLAVARTLVLQDTGVLADGRWRVAAVHPAARGVTADAVRGWLARAAGGGDAPAIDFADALVRRWWRHGAPIATADGGDIYLAGPRPLRDVWGLTADTDENEPAPAAPATAVVRRLTLVAGGRVVARVVLASRWRPGAAARLRALRGLGFERVALLPEDDAAPVPPGVECIGGSPAARGERLAQAVRDGEPLVLVHSVFRDLVPAGSIGLAPADADAGAHGVLLGDPLASLVTARGVARDIHRRLRRQQAAATAVNAALMTTAALRWLPPVATSLLHHGFVLAMLADSVRLDALDAPDDNTGLEDEGGEGAPHPATPPAPAALPTPLPMAQE